MADPIPALSLRQPWAWSVCAGYKPVENRDWPTARRGIVLIHAGLRAELLDVPFVVATVAAQTGRSHQAVADELSRGRHLGAIVGAVRLVDCVEAHPSPWFFGRYGFVFDRAMPLDRPIPCKGALSFFAPPPDVLEQLDLVAIRERLDG